MYVSHRTLRSKENSERDGWDDTNMKECKNCAAVVNQDNKFDAENPYSLAFFTPRKQDSPQEQPSK